MNRLMGYYYNLNGSVVKQFMVETGDNTIDVTYLA